MKLTIIDKGDPSCGIMSQYWEVDCPFVDKEDVEEDDLEFFKDHTLTLYQQFADNKLIAMYDYEFKLDYNDPINC